MNKNKNDFLLNSNFLNFVPIICSLLVIMIHCFNVQSLANTSASFIVVNFFSHGITMAAVPTFFFISGYLFFRNVVSLNDVLKKKKKRVIGILLPFLAWSAFYYVLYGLLSTLKTDFTKLSVFAIIKGVLFYEHIYPLWYMFQLAVYVFLLSALIYFLLKKKIIFTVLILASLAVGIFALEAITVDVGGYTRPILLFEYLGYYLLGCLFSQGNLGGYIKNFVQKIPTVVFITVYLLSAFAQSLLYADIVSFLADRLFVPIVFASFFMMLLKICDTQKELPRLNFSTFVIYAVHMFSITIIDNLLLRRIAIPVVLEFFAMFILAALLSMLFGYIIKKIKPLNFILSGNR